MPENTGRVTTSKNKTPENAVTAKPITLKVFAVLFLAKSKIVKMLLMRIETENKIANQYVMVLTNTLADNNKSKKIDHAVSDRIPANRVNK
ncbi:hypothetical protein EPI66_08895 [Salmonella enterica]|nr:hypothetical protein [Salmonella enterica]EAP9302584.1 hypothetical protein [Salmonella enterica]EDC5812028.1 hypothetical protein [Salmonella enterica]EEM1750071.1 hypothetical protein [Salmonella enterica subsp. enterica serovar Altona]EEX0204680.1 hypothetical protein [Salmonella enterica]